MTDTTIPHRVCLYCILLKPAREFISTPAGFTPFVRCKDCDEAMGRPTCASKALRVYGPVQHRTCTKCDETKQANDFMADPKRPGGISSHCKVCGHASQMRRLNTAEGRANRQAHDRKPHILAKKREERRERRKRNRQPPQYTTSKHTELGRKERKLKQKYGLTLEGYTNMSKTQGDVCAICGTINASGWALAVDHCHISGAVRGLLCIRCNAGLGNFKDSPELLEKAIQYLRTHQEKEKAA